MKKYYLFNSVDQKEYPKLTFEELLPIINNSSNVNDWLIWTEGYKDWTPLAQSPVYEMLYKSEKTNTAIRPPPIKPPPKSETVIKAPVAESTSIKSQTVIKSQPVEQNTVAKSVSTQAPVEQNTVAKNISALKPIELKSTEQKPVEQNTISKKTIPQEGTLLKVKSPAQVTPIAQPVEELWSKDERRKHPRVKTKLRVIITNNEKTFLTHCLDVSMGGLKLEKAIPKALFNKECEIYICGADGKESIVFKCTPVGQEGNPNRLQFSESDTRYSEKLSSWLEQYKDYPVNKTNIKKVG